MNPRGRLLPSLQIALLLLPGAYVLRLALLAGPLPDWDYWTILASVIDAQGFTSDLSAWLRPQNEHFLIFTRLIYALNVGLTGGHNVGLALWAWAAAFAQALLLLWLVRRTLSGAPALQLLLALTIGLVVFSPRGWHNWLMGMSGVAWITANLCTIGALTALYRSTLSASVPWLVASLGGGMLASTTYSTGLGVWPALLVLALLLRLPARRLAAVVLSAALVVAVYAALYERPAQHPELQRSITLAGDYLLLFVGGTWSVEAAPGRLFGAAGLTLAVMLWIVHLRRGREPLGRSAPWMALQGYALANGAMAALARSGFGAEQALSSRYASLPALFWIGLFALASLTWRAGWRRTAMTACLALALLLMVPGVYQMSRQPTATYLARAQLKPLAAASLYSGAPDLALLEEAVAPAGVVRSLERSQVARGLRRIGHVPFARLFEGCPRPGETITVRSPPGNPHSGPGGYLELAERRGQGTLRLQGWASAGAQVPTCVAFASERGVVRGVAAIGYPRPDVAETTPGVTRLDTGWRGYAAIRPDDAKLEVLLLPAPPGPWFRLRGAAVLTRGEDGNTEPRLVEHNW